MKNIILKFISLLLSIILLSFACFSLAYLSPQDPLEGYYGASIDRVNAANKAKTIARLGLDKPFLQQYEFWIKNLIKGNFGMSLKHKKPALDVFLKRLPNTILLSVLGFLFIFVLSIVLALICVLHEGRFFDKLICRLGTLTSSIPEFWLSLMSILIFSIYLAWLPSSGAYSPLGNKDVKDRILHLILPLSIVILDHLWYYAFILRNKLLVEVRADYVLFARSKGLSSRSVLFKHCLRNSMPAYLSLMAIALPHILGSTYIIELVFAYPGIGSLAYESARYKDYSLLMLISLFTGVLVICFSMIANAINEKIDPRIKLNIKGGALLE